MPRKDGVIYILIKKISTAQIERGKIVRLCDTAKHESLDRV